ncbi:hypothetical protein SEMRO_920_G220250.1 [Seminavis robusta]|uniref:Uncharacterized protein n=1 Tax=Seminavis robusta TaxID=568900 RepID=A0A9N8EBD0_9STRA|nr:hypothetical protein SEMRO_920_G220250.1 [Seminavis robusta]|eukprot:Sro920_g220250.1 n/a (114) ;mRNA; r:21986-22327
MGAVTGCFIFGNNNKQWGASIIMFSASVCIARAISKVVDGYDHVAMVGGVVEVLFPVATWAFMKDDEADQSTDKRKNLQEDVIIHTSASSNGTGQPMDKVILSAEWVNCTFGL